METVGGAVSVIVGVGVGRTVGVGVGVGSGPDVGVGVGEFAEPPKAAAPNGEPKPLGPSYPVSAVQRYAGLQDPFAPLIMS